MKYLKQLNTFLQKTREFKSLYFDIQTDKYNILAVGLGYSTACDNHNLFELGFSIHFFSVLFTIPNYWYKSSTYYDVEISTDMTITIDDQKLLWSDEFILRFTRTVKTVDGFYNYKSEFVVTAADYKL